MSTHQKVIQIYSFFFLFKNSFFRIDVVPKAIFWSETGEMLTIVCDSSFYILRYNKAEAQKYLEGEESEAGCEQAFEALQEFNEKVTKGIWVGDCFVYTNSNNKLNYCIGEEVVTVAHLDKKMYLLGYIPKMNKLILSDKTRNISSYTLHVSIVNYQTAVLRGDIEGAQKILPQIPKDMLNRIAQFLDAQGYKELALEVAQDLDHKFELAMNLQKFEIAFEIAEKEQSDYKWKQLGDMAISLSDFPLAEKCLISGGDINALFLIYIISGNLEGIERLSKMAIQSGKNNIAFISLFLQKRVNECVDLLCTTGRIPEAAFFARTYAPSRVSDVLKLWKSQFSLVNPKAAQSLADPHDYPNLFPNFDLALKAEKQIYPKFQSLLPSSSFVETYIESSYLKTDLIEMAQQLDQEDSTDQIPNIQETPQEQDPQQIPIQPPNPSNQQNTQPNLKEQIPTQTLNPSPQPNLTEQIPTQTLNPSNQSNLTEQIPIQPSNPSNQQNTQPNLTEQIPTQTLNPSPQPNTQIENNNINDDQNPPLDNQQPPQNNENDFNQVLKDIEDISSEEFNGDNNNDENLDWPEDFEDN